MVRRAVFVPVLVLFFVLSAGHVQAALHDRLGGLIYDDVLDVTWLQDASYAQTSGYVQSGKLNWYDAVNWASTLSYYDTERGVTWDDWRLPTTTNHADSIGWDTTGMSSEMAYMYYVNLGYDANMSLDPSDPAPTSGNYNPFINLQTRGYWSGTPSDFENRAWYLHMHFGYQDINSKLGDEQRLWAVRDGDVAPVPIPPAMLLMASGLLFLRVMGRKGRST
ncbi:MAG: DUF1566 domain-containing protein [Candidatus Thiodiazotropha sp. (ex Codakia rugifera)]|nr:DUF1566 domain-containing protein [Candidatus Thiodiazotropha sp. (ex Codakia rugifera)]